MHAEWFNSVPGHHISTDLGALCSGFVLGSLQLAFARQDVKERGERDDAGRRSDDSYSPHRHWCSMFKPDGEAWVRGLHTDV